MNAKELILKKINADTNWVDIYTSAFVLGEDLNTIGSFMISPEISELISKYSSSLFDPDASFETKIQFIEKNISEADTPSKKYAYTELLERVKIAEELRILGKILKINQGMPTNTADFYEYIGKIEYFIESRLNSENISAALSFSKSQKQFTEVSDLFIEFLNVINEILNNDITEESIKKHQNKINSFLKAAKLSPDNFNILREYYQKSKGRLDINAEEYQKLPKQIQDILNINVDKNSKLDFKNCTNFVNSLNAIYEIMTLPGKNIDNGHKQIFENLKSDFWGFVQKCFDSKSSYFSWVYDVNESNNKTSNKLWANLQESWKKFDLVHFVKNKEYAQSMILEYENVKVKFNILDTLISLPHFNEMYKVLALNDGVLTALSKRNKIESEVWRRAIHKKKDKASALMTAPNTSERKILKSLVDDALIQTWLTTGLTDFYLSSPDGTRIDFDGSLNISKLKSFIETSIIPRLHNNKFIINGQIIDTKSNEFVRRLTFGKHNGESIFKLSFNMSEIDSNPGIKQEYEKILQAFGELRNIHLEGGLTIVDVFYLYNLIVHKDHFGRNSLTRLFEDLISSKEGEKLLVFKFNEWLETVNEQEIIDKVLSSWGASHRNDLSSTGNSTQIYISTNPLNKSMQFYSGKANGSDSAWGLYLRQQGFTVKDYTVDDWRALSAEQKGYYEQLYQEAINLIGTEGWPADSYAGELTRRDMMQADSATSIFAIGTLSNSGKINGGTKYATYAAISQGKPVYLFNLNNNSWYWYDYNSSSFIKMNDKPNLISGAAVIGTRDDKSKTGAEALRTSGHEAIKDIIDRSLKLSAHKTRTVKYTPKGQAEQTFTIIGTKIFNKEGNEVYSDENSGHRKLIFVELALQEKRAVKVEYRNVTYVVNDRNQIFSTSSNKIVYQNENDGNRRVILEKAKEEFAKLSNQSSPRVEIYQGYWTREEVESQTNKVFLFGDNTNDRVNTHYVPSRTQAIIRGLPNAIGIDTKKNRGTSEGSYFTDADFDIFKAQVDEAIQRAINSGKTIVIPADGIGTGKAELDKRAPKLFAYLQQRLDELKKLNSSSPVQFDDSIDISEESVAEEPVTIGFDNTSDRVSEESNESNYIEPIRRLQLLDDYYRPIFTSEELISFEEDAKRIFDNESILNERVNIHYSEWKILDDITDMRRWEKIWEDIVYDEVAEESENDFKYNNKSKTVQIPKYIYDRIKLYQKYQKLVDFLMGIAQKNNYYDYYGNLLRHDEDWFGSERIDSLVILKDLYDLAGIKEIYDNPNQLRLFDSLYNDDNNSAQFVFEDKNVDAPFYIESDEEYTSYLLENELSREKADIFIHNFVTKILNVSPKYKATLNANGLLRAYQTKQGIIGQSINKVSKKIFGYDVYLDDRSREKFIESLDRELSNWVANLSERVNNASEQLSSIYQQIYKQRDAIRLLQVYIHSNLNLDLFTETEKDIINEILRYHSKTDSKKSIGYIIQKEKAKLKSLETQLQSINYRIHAIKLAAKNRLLAMNLLPNLKELVKTRLLAEYDSYTFSEKDYNTWIKPYESLAEAVDDILNNPSNEGVLNLNIGEISFDDLVNKIKNIYPEYTDLLDLIQTVNPTLKIEIVETLGYENGGEVGGKFKPSENKVLLLPNKSIIIAIHELIHAASYYGLVGHSEGSEAFEEKVMEFIKYIREYCDNAKIGSLFKSDILWGTEFPASIYGMTNASEFIAETMSNPQFQQVLDQIPAMKPKKFNSLLEEVVDGIIGWFKRLFRKPKKVTALTQARKLALAAMRIQQDHFEEIEKQLRNRKNKSQNYLISAKDYSISAMEYEEISENISEMDPTPVYQTTPSKQSKLIELVRQANEKGVKGIHIVSQSDLVNEDVYVRSAKGFVRNGEIYINVDRAGDDTVIHEFGHLYLADAKVNNREKYYELLEKVRQTKLWSDMKTWKAYANKIGSDFDEEVLATMIGDYYKSEFGIDYEYTDLVKETLSLVDGGFIDLINSEILPDLGDTFITNYALSQRTATLKHKLVSDNILKENCL